MMFAAAILAASLAVPAPAVHAPARQTLTQQVQAHALVLAALQTPAEDAEEKKKDYKWDGALAGALAGAGIGVLSGLLFYGKGGGEWPSQGEFMAGTTLFGAMIGSATGLIIDLVRK